MKPIEQDSAQRLRDLLSRSGYTQRGAARELGVPERQFRYWCSSRERPPPWVCPALERLFATRAPIGTGCAALEDALLKHARAGEHLTALENEIATYNASGSLSFNPVIENGFITAEPFASNPPPPYSRFSVIVGDCLTNLQAALDYVAWQLACKWSGGLPPVPRMIFFRNVAGLQRVPNADQRAIAHIETCLQQQCSHDLQHLVSGDKHQNLRLTTVRVKNRGRWWIEINGQQIYCTEPIARLPEPPPLPGHDRMWIGGMGGEFYIDLVFLNSLPGHSQQSRVSAMLSELIDYIGKAIVSFEQFLG